MIKKIKKLFKKPDSNEIGWFGNYSNWQEALDKTTGYDAANILEKTKQSLLKIKNGEAVYERDSVLFDKKEYPYPIISSLLYIAIKNNNQLNVIDFGGSLGSTWFQVKDFIPDNIKVTWTIVEQAEYVKCGNDFFEDDTLKFRFSIEEGIKEFNPNVILLSSVVQYLEKPHEFMSSLNKHAIQNIIFDRTAFIQNQKADRLTIQVVPPDVYEASYPSWFFYEETFLKHFSNYSVKAEFQSYVVGESTMFIDGKELGQDKGFFLERK